LLWDEAEENNAHSKITSKREANLSNKTTWDEHHRWLIERGERFHEAFYDRIQTL